MTTRCDAVVIGSGPGGYVCGIRLAQLGKKAIVVERSDLGGVCLNVGCIPSKALISQSKLFEKIGKARDQGIVADGVRVDLPRMQKWKQEVVGKLTGGVATLLKGNGAEVRRGAARITGPRTVEVRGADGAAESIEADAIVVATGSRPVQIPGFEFDEKRVLSSTGALALEEIPTRLTVIGGGYIGLELGTVFARLGSKVTVVEMTDQLLPGMDPDLVKVVERHLKKRGVEILLRSKAGGFVEEKGTLRVSVQPPDGGAERILEADRILVTVGRRPNTEDLGLDRVGIALERGLIPVDESRRTSVPSIYAIGDVTAGPALAHKASREGEVAAEAIAGKRSAFDPRAIPAVVFTEPEIAYVGLQEHEAARAGRAVKVGKFGFGAIGRTLTNADPVDGFAKIVADPESGEILGVAMVGAGVTDLIAEAGLAIEMGAVLEDVALTIHAHPTLPEALMEAAKAALGEAIHTLNRP